MVIYPDLFGVSKEFILFAVKNEKSSMNSEFQILIFAGLEISINSDTI